MYDNLTKKRVMVLGALGDEVPLVNAFKTRGYFVIVVGAGLDYPCVQIADKFYDIDIRDREKLLNIAKKENVVAVASNVVSIAVEITAWLNDCLKLPGITYEVAHCFTNKALMREKARMNGVFNPDFKWVKNIEDAVCFAEKTGFPLIIKPVDGNSSKGVIKVNNIKELRECFEESICYALNDEGCIIEEFIEGPEYIVDGFSIDGKCINTDVAFKDHFSVDNRFISKAVVIQDALHCTTEIEKKLLEAHKRTVEGLGLSFGPTHGEYIFCPNNNSVYLVEVAARGGGIRLSSDMIPLATGIDINELVAEHALGISHTEDLHIKEGAAAWFAFALKEGIITRVSGLNECMEIGGVYLIDSADIEVGKKARTLVNDSGKYGPIVTYGKTREECYQIFEKVKNILEIDINGESGIIW